MLTTAGTDAKAQLVIFLMAAVVGLATVVPGQWQAVARRSWSYAVYYVGYRLLSVQISCGSLAVSGVPFVMKYV